MNDALRKLYAELPRLDCKGQCWRSCGPIGVSPAEATQMEAASRARGGAPETEVEAVQMDDGTIWIVGEPGQEFTCPLLDFAGRCTVYDVRPMICRLWGVVENMPCPFGCVPEGGHLPRHVGFRLLAEAMHAGGVHMDPEQVERGLRDGGELAAYADELTARGIAADRRRMLGRG